MPKNTITFYFISLKHKGNTINSGYIIHLSMGSYMMYHMNHGRKVEWAVEREGGREGGRVVSSKAILIAG